MPPSPAFPQIEGRIWDICPPCPPDGKPSGYSHEVRYSGLVSAGFSRLRKNSADVNIIPAGDVRAGNIRAGHNR